MPSRAARTIFFIFAVLLIWVNSSPLKAMPHRCFFIHGLRFPAGQRGWHGDAAFLIIDQKSMAMRRQSLHPLATDLIRGVNLPKYYFSPPSS